MKVIGKIQLENIESSADYRLREAVRAIVLRGDKMALLYVSNENYHKLPGGGIEKGENLKEALEREILEEVGVTIEDIKEVGEIEECRREHKLRQTSYCYVAKVKEDVGELNFTEEEKEEGFELKWVSINEALDLMKRDIPKDYLGTYVKKRDISILDYAIKNNIDIKKLLGREDETR